MKKSIGAMIPSNKFKGVLDEHLFEVVDHGNGRSLTCFRRNFSFFWILTRFRFEGVRPMLS